ncbi:MAG: flavodoxin [Tuberibacillus sp.]
MRVLICYASFSGNTKEVAELIKNRLEQENFKVDMHRIHPRHLATVDPSLYDVMLIGTFTWGKGTTPKFVKDFIFQIGYKPPHVFVFGTGDTQFGGDDLFCHASVKLAKFYNSPLNPLKIEQSPRGIQETKVLNWTEGVIHHCNQYLAESVF